MAAVVSLQDTPIDVAALLAAVRDDEHGAVALFLGTVRRTSRGRTVLGLWYEAYPEMARAVMERIVAETVAAHAVGRLALVHRTGQLAVGEIAVAVAVGAAHRAGAQAACRDVIERVKSEVPLWKREAFEGGEAWIEGAGEVPAGGQANPSRSRSSSSSPR